MKNLANAVSESSKQVLDFFCSYVLTNIVLKCTTGISSICKEENNGFLHRTKNSSVVIYVHKLS